MTEKKKLLLLAGTAAAAVVLAKHLKKEENAGTAPDGKRPDDTEDKNRFPEVRRGFLALESAQEADDYCAACAATSIIEKDTAKLIWNNRELTDTEFEEEDLKNLVTLIVENIAAYNRELQYLELQIVKEMIGEALMPASEHSGFASLLEENISDDLDSAYEVVTGFMYRVYMMRPEAARRAAAKGACEILTKLGVKDI